MIGVSKHLHRRLSYRRQLEAFRRASTLVIAEHDNVTLSPSSLSAVTAAGELKGDVTLLVVGHESHAVVEQVICPHLLSRSSTWSYPAVNVVPRYHTPDNSTSCTVSIKMLIVVIVYS